MASLLHGEEKHWIWFPVLRGRLRKQTARESFVSKLFRFLKSLLLAMAGLIARPFVPSAAHADGTLSAPAYRSGVLRSSTTSVSVTPQKLIELSL